MSEPLEQIELQVLGITPARHNTAAVTLPQYDEHCRRRHPNRTPHTRR
ncbi:MAG TPA: hypothetical protein VKK81_21705 [Candidatus Binatia bacterium]|nr:hypothetical protein [Candidatus Binatia bacterium]